MRRELVTYAAVFVALIALLALSVVAAPAGIVVSLAIAGTKVFLIAFFFMRLREENALGWAFAGAGLVLGLIGTLLLFADVLTR